MQVDEDVAHRHQNVKTLYTETDQRTSGLLCLVGEECGVQIFNVSSMLSRELCDLFEISL